MKNILIYLLAALMTTCLGCARPSDDDQFITTSGKAFIDPQGRQLILHGINVVNKNPAVNYLGDEGPADFAAMRSWGFNCIRLGIIWDGLEPEPGVYDENYLAGIDKRIQWAQENDLYVILDMHQDLYSVLFSDGAPEWATITDGHTFEKGHAVWSDAYFTSPAVQTAWDHFWANSPAPDGIGLQDHYAAAWQHVAKRYAENPAVIGFDLMNEPFPGSEAQQIFPAMLTKGAELLQKLPGFGSPSMEELAYKWSTHDGRFELLKVLEDTTLYRQVVDAPAPIYQQFDREKLMPMYNRVARAIRQVDKNHILFLGTTLGSNMGVYSAIEPVTNEAGERDPLQAYAPHGYDLVTDTKYVASPNYDRIRFIFNRHRQTAERLNMPVVVGEWGAYGRYKGTLPAALNVVAQFETFHFSDTYWDHDKGMESYDHFPALSRPVPLRLAGSLQEYHYDAEARAFSCTWAENQNLRAPSVIYLPVTNDLEPDIKLKPPGRIRKKRIGEGLFIEIETLNKRLDRELRVSLKNR